MSHAVDVKDVVPTTQNLEEFGPDAYIYCRKADNGAAHLHSSGEHYWVAGNEWAQLQDIMGGKGRDSRFGSFIEERTGYNIDYVRKVILVSRKFTEKQAKLAIGKEAMLLLCYDDEAREEAVKAAENGEIITKKKAAALKKKSRKRSAKKLGAGTQLVGETSSDGQQDDDASEDADESVPVKQKPVAHEVKRTHKAHEMAKSMRGMSQRIAKLVTEITEAGTLKGGEKIDVNQICADLRNAAEGIKDAVPYADCPYCKAKGCNTCDQLGWLAEFRWSSIDKAKKN